MLSFFLYMYNKKMYIRGCWQKNIHIQKSLVYTSYVHYFVAYIQKSLQNAMIFSTYTTKNVYSNILRRIYKVLLIYIIFCMFSCFFVYIYKIYEYIFVYILFFLYMGKTVIHCQQSTQMHLPNDPRMEERPIINVYTVQIMFVCALWLSAWPSPKHSVPCISHEVFWK